MNKKMPKWLCDLYKMIHRNWEYHSPSEKLNTMASYDFTEKIWNIKVAPVFQEVYGGTDDGKQVWSGFVFNLDEFAKENGMWVQNFAVASACRQCSPSPKLLVKGKFKGNCFILQLFLEPVPDSDPVEIVDMISQRVREMPNE